MRLKKEPTGMFLECSYLVPKKISKMGMLGKRENVFHILIANVTSIIFEILDFFFLNCDGGF